MTGPLGDLPGEREGRGVGVVVGRRVGGFIDAGGEPGVERDARRAKLVGQLVPDDLRLEPRAGLEGVVRRERLVGPAVGQQRTVEPGVGGLVEDHERIGVVGDLDPVVGRVEEAGVTAGAPADGLLDDERLVTPPGEPGELAENRQGVLEQRADPFRPVGVIRPGADRHVGGRAAHLGAEVGLRVGTRPIGHEVGEELGRVGQLFRGVDGPAGVVGRRRRQLARLHLDGVALGEDDAHGPASDPVRIAVAPDRERHERRAHPDLAGGGATRIGQVEREPERRALAGGDPLPERQGEDLVGAALLADPDGWTPGG